MPAEDRRAGPAAKREALHNLVRAGTSVGLIGYLEQEPVAWVSVAPKATYRSFEGRRPLGTGPPRDWSLACMYLKRRLRGQSLTSELIGAAIEHARNNGAGALEAYPVDVGAPSYRFMGFVPSFERLGFRDLGMAGTRRHLMRLELD